MQRGKSYPGRVIFDHLPKTAGQAINAWLSETLGSGCVSGNQIAGHRELIQKLGGVYSLLTAHLSFDGRGLDSRYEYVTVLREPVDRALSLIFFVLNNHSDHELREIRQGVKRFLETDGAEGREFVNVMGSYVEHFCSVRGVRPVNDEEALSLASDVLDEYALWGLYERMPEFLADFAAFLGVPAPERLAPVNVTSNRPFREEISPAISARLEELYAMDIEFYRRLLSRYDEARQRWQRPPVTESRWLKLDEPPPRREFDQGFVLLRIDQSGGRNVDQHAILGFELEFSLVRPVESLECGFYIYDADIRGLAFGVSNTMTGTVVGPLAAGTHCVRHTCIADLPSGIYDVSFAFHEKRAEGDRLLAWADKAASFQVTLRRHLPSVGYSCVQAAMTCWKVDDRVVSLVEDARGEVELAWDGKAVAAGEQWSMPVRVINRSGQAWRGMAFHPLNLSYHWLDEDGNVVVFDGLRTPLPEVPMGGSIDTALSVMAPGTPGRYRLRVLPVQEAHAWLDEKGFAPGERLIEVRAPCETASANDGGAARPHGLQPRSSAGKGGRKRAKRA